MILKPKPLDQKTDAELDKDLNKVIARNGWFYRNQNGFNGAIAVALFAAGYYTAKAMIVPGLAMAGTAGMPLVLGGIVLGPAIWAVGLVGAAIGWTNIANRVARVFHRQATAIVTEQKDREFKKTPAYKEILHRAAEEAVRIKDNLKKAFNAAVDRTFHGGTEKKVTVKKPLVLKKPGEEPKKKTIFGLKI